jgi:hypothetical protein
VQSIIVGAVLIIISILIFIIGLIGEILAINRLLQEETLYYLKRLHLSHLDGKSLDDDTPVVLDT